MIKREKKAGKTGKEDRSPYADSFLTLKNGSVMQTEHISGYGMVMECV